MAAKATFTIGTLVNNSQLYNQMLQSFRQKGFGDDCEFIKIDNTGDQQTDAYAGLNQILNKATAPIVILCHQDVMLIGDGRAQLDARLRELSAIDPHWAVAGNAGASSLEKLHIRITDRHGDNQNFNGPFPVRVHSIDENFMVVKSEARISLSRDLRGFHMYGTDICMIAEMLGWNSYVIDFHLNHLGEGKIDDAFKLCIEQFREKWELALRDRHLRTTCTDVVLRGSAQHGFSRHPSSPKPRSKTFVSRWLKRLRNVRQDV